MGENDLGQNFLYLENDISTRFLKSC